MSIYTACVIVLGAACLLLCIWGIVTKLDRED